MKKLLLLLFILFLIPFANAQDIKLNGTTSAENNQIKNVANPTDAQDAVTLSVLLEKITALQDQIDNAGIGSITDVDGNTYNSLTYGNQVWTVENAEMVTYRDGTAIPQVTDNTAWENLTTGAWCYYYNDPTNPRFYNWYAVMGIHDTDPNTPNKEFAPEGWHVPTDAEWTTLENYLIANSYNYDFTKTENKIAKAMASTTVGWERSTEPGAIGNDLSLNNDSGFNAFPDGERYDNGSFSPSGDDTFFWSSTEINTTNVWIRSLYYDNSNLFKFYSFVTKGYGYSVRFVRD
jgi:uncharacterized protein (TIGR02145 family)